MKHLDPKILGHLTYEHGPYSITKIKNSIMTLLSAVRLAPPAPSQHTGWSDEAVEASSRYASRLEAIVENVDDGSFYHDPDRARLDVQALRHIVKLLHSEARAALTAASTIAPATGFEVRPLQWEKHNVDGTFWTSEVTICGEYKVQFTGKEWSAWVGVITIAKTETCAQAKAAAFEYHDRRIRSSIAPSVAKESGEP